jgi:hypothetical protein
MPRIPPSHSIGLRYGQLTVQSVGGRTKNRHVMVLAKCDCGSLKEYFLYKLKEGTSKSCGCWHDSHNPTSIETLLDSAAPIPDTGCWLWAGKTSPGGYGKIVVKGRNIRAHRLAYELVHGPIKDGLWVLHRCDTPACIWPGHLWLGSVKDNNRDMARKGRHSFQLGTSGLQAWARKILGLVE